MTDLELRRSLRDDWVAAQESGTAVVYAADIDRFFAWCDEQGVDVLAARRRDIDRWRQSLLRRVSRRTTAKYLSVASSFYRYAIREGEVDGLEHNPVQNVRRPKITRESKRQGLTAEEARALRALSLAAGPRTAALVHLALGTGARVSELCSAKVDELGWWDGVRVLHVVRKGGLSARLPIQGADSKVLDAYLDGRRDVPGRWLLATVHGPLSRHSAYRDIHRLAKQVNKDKKIGPHSLRRTAATLSLSAGVPIQEVQALLGHASSATTQLYDAELANRGRRASVALSGVYAGEDE